MLILEISGGIPSGTYLSGLFAQDQACALADLGHEVVFAVVDLRSIRRKRRLGIHKYKKGKLNVFSIAVPVGAVPAIIKDPIGKWALNKLYKHIEKDCGRPDIIHAHFLEMGVIAAGLCTAENLPLVITEHSSVLNQENLPLETVKRAKYAYSNAKKVIAVSNALAAKINKYTNIEPVVVPNIVNMPEVQLNNNKEKKIFHFVSAGNLLQGKGFDVLLKAFAHVLNHKPDTRLTIMGAGSEEANLKNLADELCLNNNVSFYGRYNREQFAQQLDGADTFVLASRGETFGVVYIEALSFGLPVIATHCGGPDDIVDESNGVLVDVDDVKGLAKAMVNMVDNIEKYDRNEISRRVRKIFSGESIAMQLTKIFSRILDGYYEKE